MVSIGFSVYPVQRLAYCPLYMMDSKHSIFVPLLQSGPKFLPLPTPVVAEDNFDQEKGTRLLSNLKLLNVRLIIEVTKAVESQRYL